MSGPRRPADGAHGRRAPPSLGHSLRQAGVRARRRAAPSSPVPQRDSPGRRRRCRRARRSTRAAISARSRRLVRLRTTAPRRPWRRQNRPAAVVPRARRSGPAWTTMQRGACSGSPGAPECCREVRLVPAAGAPRAARGRPQAESSERPLARRADRMARPARVRMRRRKPWVLARRRLFGWKVRLLTRFSVTGQARVAC